MQSAWRMVQSAKRAHPTPYTQHPASDHKTTDYGPQRAKRLTRCSVTICSLKNPNVYRYSKEASRSEVRVKGKGVADALLPHQGEARGVHITKGMVSVAMQDLVSVSFQVFSYEEAFGFLLHSIRTIRFMLTPQPARLGRPQNYSVLRFSVSGATRDFIESINRKVAA